MLARSTARRVSFGEPLDDVLGDSAGELELELDFEDNEEEYEFPSREQDEGVDAREPTFS
jgi:hypothetical protein